MTQNDMLKVLLANDALLKQTATKETTKLSSILPGGILPVASGGTGADLSATGGANRIVRQNSAGGAFTVSVLASGDIPSHPYTLLTFSGLTAGAVFRATSATAASFGQVDLADTDAVTGTLAAARGGTGVSNGASATLTLPNTGTTISGGGTIALGGFTLTVPATGTVALLAVSNTFGVDQNFSQDITVTGGINVGSGSGAGAGEITTSGNGAFGAAISSTVRLYSKGSGSTSGTFCFIAQNSTGSNVITARNDGALGFLGAAAVNRPTVSGSRGGNAALASLLTGLANLGLITDSSSA